MFSIADLEMTRGSFWELQRDKRRSRLVRRARKKIDEYLRLGPIDNVAKPLDEKGCHGHAII